MNLPPTYYQVAADLGEPYGLATSDPLHSFDDACDAYSEHMERYEDAVVFLVQPPVGKMAGSMSDVTDDANLRIAARIRCRPGYHEMPEWLAEAY